MVTFEDIRKANDTIKTTPIQGKDYAEVNQRIKAFRMVYPTGAILTDMAKNENGVCVFTAACGYYTEDGNFIVLGTGTAYEKENSTFINKTSYIENCAIECPATSVWKNSNNVKSFSRAIRKRCSAARCGGITGISG